MEVDTFDLLMVFRADKISFKKDLQSSTIGIFDDKQPMRKYRAVKKPFTIYTGSN